MSRTFNTTGPCLPEKHDVLAPERRLGEIRVLIDAEAFFAIHAPRHPGKTALLRTLSRSLPAADRHAAVTVSRPTPDFVGRIRPGAASRLRI